MSGEQIAKTVTRPAPIGGWNVRDALAMMDAKDAIVLDNWEPLSDRVRLRKGFATHVDVGPSAVDTLTVWNGGTASKMWALNAPSGAIRATDVTAAGIAIPADATFTALAHTGSIARYSSVMFNNVAGFYLYLVDENGVNPPCVYNGSVWAAPTITGVTPANLVHVNLHQYRLWFVEKGTLNLWYLPLDSIAGAAQKMPLGGYFNAGGSLVASATWTGDAGEGIDDRLVAITSRGQIAIFEGNDPASSSAWQLAGIFQTARPLGRRCFFRLGADLIVITIDGLHSLDEITSKGTAASAITDKVRGAFNAAAQTLADTNGWEGVYYPRGKKILVNVPGDATPSVLYQYVMNAETGAWCRFVGQNARDLCLMGDNLYFADPAGKIRRMDAQSSDAGVAITADAQQAFDYFDSRGSTKYFTMLAPIMDADTLILPTVSLATDFTIPPPAGQVFNPGGWATYGAVGDCASVRLGISTSVATVNWYATKHAVELGGVI